MFERLFSVLLPVGVVLTGGAPAWAQPVVQTTKAVTFQDTQDTFLPPVEIAGSSAKLTRYEDAVGIRINTTGLPAGAYTVWWVVFNNPDGCVGGCGEDDLFRPEVMTSIFWATGGIVGENGVGHFRAMTGENEMPGQPGQVVWPGPGGLLDSYAAEIHLVVKTHGEVIPSIVEKQITTIYGACTDPPGAVPHPVDPVESDRLFPCYDPQAAVFPAEGPTANESGAADEALLETLSKAVSENGRLLERVAQRMGLKP